MMEKMMKMFCDLYNSYINYLSDFIKIILIYENIINLTKLKMESN